MKSAFYTAIVAFGYGDALIVFLALQKHLGIQEAMLLNFVGATIIFLLCLVLDRVFHILSKNKKA